MRAFSDLNPIVGFIGDEVSSSSFIAVASKCVSRVWWSPTFIPRVRHFACGVSFRPKNQPFLCATLLQIDERLVVEQADIDFRLIDD